MVDLPALLLLDADHVALYYVQASSHQMRWYLERTILAGAYHATELYWLNDTSEDSRETWRFLERGLDDVHQFRQNAADATNKVACATDAVTSTIATLFKASRSAY
jgi:ubiquinone biosynthesis protein COQ9